MRRCLSCKGSIVAAVWPQLMLPGFSFVVWDLDLMNTFMNYSGQCLYTRSLLAQHKSSNTARDRSKLKAMDVGHRLRHDGLIFLQELEQGSRRVKRALAVAQQSLLLVPLETLDETCLKLIPNIDHLFAEVYFARAPLHPTNLLHTCYKYSPSGSPSVFVFITLSRADLKSAI